MKWLLLTLWIVVQVSYIPIFWRQRGSVSNNVLFLITCSVLKNKHRINQISTLCCINLTQGRGSILSLANHRAVFGTFFLPSWIKDETSFRWGTNECGPMEPTKSSPFCGGGRPSASQSFSKPASVRPGSPECIAYRKPGQLWLSSCYWLLFLWRAGFCQVNFFLCQLSEQSEHCGGHLKYRTALTSTVSPMNASSPNLISSGIVACNIW